MDRPVRVLMISSEVDPFARSGGLGDAVGGLSRALARLGADVVVVTPLYGVTKIPQAGGSWWEDTGGAGSHRTCFLAHDQLFGSRGLYDDPGGGAYGDNDVRFVTMSRGAL